MANTSLISSLVGAFPGSTGLSQPGTSSVEVIHFVGIKGTTNVTATSYWQGWGSKLPHKSRGTTSVTATSYWQGWGTKLPHKRR